MSLTAEPNVVQRQETQIVQSELTLDDSLPGFAPPVLRLPYLYTLMGDCSHILDESIEVTLIPAKVQTMAL